MFLRRISLVIFRGYRRVRAMCDNAISKYLTCDAGTATVTWNRFSISELLGEDVQGESKQKLLKGRRAGGCVGAVSTRDLSMIRRSRHL